VREKKSSSTHWAIDTRPVPRCEDSPRLCVHFSIVHQIAITQSFENDIFVMILWSWCGESNNWVREKSNHRFHYCNTFAITTQPPLYAARNFLVSFRCKHHVWWCIVQESTKRVFVRQGGCNFLERSKSNTPGQRTSMRMMHIMLDAVFENRSRDRHLMCDMHTEGTDQSNQHEITNQPIVLIQEWNLMVEISLSRDDRDKWEETSKRQETNR